MFGKYFWHELKNSYKLPAMIFGTVLICSFLCGLLININSRFLTTVAVLLLSASMFGVAFSIIFLVFHIYSKRLFNQTGYLTLTLPVSTHTIILAKTLVVLIYALSLVLMAVFAVFLFFQGAFMQIGFEGIVNFFKGIAESIAEYPLAFFIRFMVYVVETIGAAMFVLFTLSLFKMGGLNKFVKILITIILVIAIIMLFSLNYGYQLYYDEVNKAFHFMTVEAYYDMQLANQSTYIYYSEVFNLLELSATVLGILGFYFGSYYIIRNRLDIC